jgi:hypothetical protein
MTGHLIGARDGLANAIRRHEKPLLEICASFEEFELFGVKLAAMRPGVREKSAERRFADAVSRPRSIAHSAAI